jgi:ankyrin repeat protein
MVIDGIRAALITFLLFAMPVLAADNFHDPSHSSDPVLWLGELPSSLSTCGPINWVPEIGALLDYLVKERSLSEASQLMGETLTALLAALDERLTLKTLTDTSNGVPRWVAHWEGNPRQSFNLNDKMQRPRVDLVSQVHYALADVCALLREHDPDKAKKTFDLSSRGIADAFEAAFLQALRDPAAEYGFDLISLTIEAKANKHPSESFSAHWMDKQMGIARLYLPELFYGRDGHFDEAIAKLQREAPIKTLILDLRGSSGGTLDVLYSILGRFLPQGSPIYEAFDSHKQGRTVTLKSLTLPDKVLDIPVLILVSAQTRGGAEIVAGVLQATGRAKVYGEPTAGLATHKTIINLNKDKGIEQHRALLLTVERLKFPGKSQPQVQIKPDVSAPADKALEVALGTLSVNGKQVQNPFIRKDEKVSPLMRAMLADQQDEAVLFIEVGADLDVEASPDALDHLLEYRHRMERDGSTPLAGYPLATAAAALGMPRVLQAIGKREPQRLQATDSNGRTALTYAARSGFLECTRFLLSQGLDPIQRTIKYPISNTPLALAVGEHRSEVVALLVAAIPKEKYTRVEVAEQVWIAAYSSDIVTLRVLLEAGIPPSYISPQGSTALISSVQDGKLEQVQLLLKHGATVDEHRYKGKNIFEIAEEKLSWKTVETKEIYRLIQTAPRSESHWKKPADVQQLEGLWKMINDVNRTPLSR